MSTKTSAQGVLTQGEFTFFQGKDSPFTIQHEKHFVVKGSLFTSVEQYLLHKKARLFNEAEMAQEILLAKSPAEQRRLAKMVKVTDDFKWSRAAPQIVYEGSRFKFLQNPELLEKLMATRGTVLAHADAKDKEWGVGMSMHNDAILDAKLWPGKNLLGKTLTQLREDIYSGLQTNKVVFASIDAYLQACLESGALPKSMAQFREGLAQAAEKSLESIVDGTTEQFEIIPLESREPLGLQLVHHTPHQDYSYYVGLHLMRIEDGNHAKQMYHFWQGVAQCEESAQVEEEISKIYFLALTDDIFYVDGVPEELNHLATQRSNEKMTGLLAKTGVQEYVTLRGTYFTKNWKNKEHFHYQLFQVTRHTW
jgi:ribA/ribD-fused uncharacterized protein